MKKVDIIHGPQKVIRQKPKNLHESDFHLFEKVLTTEIHETTVLHLTNVNILNGDIFDLYSLKFYTTHTRILKVTATTQWKKLYLFLMPFHIVDNGIWITDEWSIEYFHWLTDALPRLIAAETIGQNFSVILPARYAQKPYIQTTLQILNIPAYYYNPRKRVLVKSLRLPSHTAPTGNYNVQIINQLRDRFIANNHSEATKKIYVSRKKAKQRKVINEEAVEGLLLQYGYEIYYFEDYTLQQQIAIMHQTKNLVGLHGAGLTNMLFMQSYGRVLELRNGQDAHNNCYFALASALNHDYYYLTNTGNSVNTYNADITVNLESLITIIERMELTTPN